MIEELSTHRIGSILRWLTPDDFHALGKFQRSSADPQADDVAVAILVGRFESNSVARNIANAHFGQTIGVRTIGHHPAGRGAAEAAAPAPLLVGLLNRIGRRLIHR